jgi:hypothetical protein
MQSPSTRQDSITRNRELDVNNVELGGSRYVDLLLETFFSITKLLCVLCEEFSFPVSIKCSTLAILLVSNLYSTPRMAQRSVQLSIFTESRSSDQL